MVTSAGFSGSPIIINRTIIGIHAGGMSANHGEGKVGRLITRELLTNLKVWFKELKIDNLEVYDEFPEYHPQTIDVECMMLLSNKALAESEKLRELLRTITRL